MTSPAGGAEIAVFVLALAAGTTAVVAATGGARRARAGLLLVLFVSTGAALAFGYPPRGRDRTPPPGRPGGTPQPAFASSAACRACHPGEHASFGRTFHRTMTAEASIASVAAPLGVPALLDGRRHVLEARGDEVWATLPDPDASGPGETRDPAPDVTRRVAITTGSHREQAYWVPGRRPGELRLFPFVWLVRERRFVPRRDAFLVPPGADMPRVRWNSNCIACHAVAGEPGHDEEKDAFDTRAAELGIACEACHGPGAAHVEKHRDPVARYVQCASKRADPTIVHPARLAPDRSAAVCGQCHAYAFPKDEAAWWSTGYARSFRAGDALERSRTLIGPSGAGVSLDASRESLFWPDGSIRVGGREYNGLVTSPCFERGEGERKLTCLSCHAMHAGDPAGQIAPDRGGERACTQCHDAARARAHTHHREGSDGAACVACHMPRTSYALFSAIRSHRIDSPTLAAVARAEKPNACNLCHLDRSLAWTARTLAAWYGGATAGAGTAAPADRGETAEGLVSALSGDAAVRVVVADALGSKEARAASGADYQAAVLAELLVDPYSAVRFVAARSLRAIPGYEDVAYDFLAPPADRARSRVEVLARFAAARSARAAASDERRRALGWREDGTLDEARLRALLAARDDRAITIAE